MKKATAVLACLTLLASGSLGQQTPTPPDPNDSPLQVMYHPASPQTQFLQKYSGAVPQTHQQGRLNFKLANGSRSAVLGSVTHSDATGNWVANEPVLSTTNNGWRLDGTANALFIRKAGPNHVITQTFTDTAARHDSVLTLTVPALTYDKNLRFHFVQDGLTWNLLVDPAGTFTFQADVSKRRAAATYTFPVTSSENLAANAAGNLGGDPHV